MMINKIVGKRIQQRRKVLDISSVYMAKQLGVSEQYYLQLESGYADIMVDELIIISKILKTSPQNLLSQLNSQLVNKKRLLEKQYH